MVKKKDSILIGKIVGVHGVKGNIKVYPYTESLSLFIPGCSIFLGDSMELTKAYILQSAKAHGKVILVSLQGITDRDSVKKLFGSNLYIKKTNLPENEEGSYYWFDLLGLSVFTGGKVFIGRIDSIIPTGSNDVYVVKNTDKGNDFEVLIPAIESVVTDIDLKRRTMEVNLPDGL